MNSDMIFQLIDKAEKIEIFKKIRVVDNTDLYQAFDFSVNKNSFLVFAKLKVEAILGKKTEGYFLQFYVNGSKAPFFVSEDFLLSKQLIEAMDKKKKTLAEMEQNKELERDRALVESLVTGEDSVANPLFKHTASEIVRGMNACEEKLTKKQEEQLAHIARMVMKTNLNHICF